VNIKSAVNILGRTTLSLHNETKHRLVKVRGKMEHCNGKQRDLEDVLNDLIDYYEENKHA
jgi:hypothetical protein